MGVNQEEESRKIVDFLSYLVKIKFFESEGVADQNSDVKIIRLNYFQRACQWIVYFYIVKAIILNEFVSATAAINQTLNQATSFLANNRTKC